SARNGDRRTLPRTDHVQEAEHALARSVVPRASRRAANQAMTATPVAGDRSGRPVEALHLNNATMMFAGVPAVRDVSLSVARGTILGIIGPSGAGKTTLIRLLTGALTPTRGTVQVLGENP